MPGGKAPRPGLICRSARPCESACAESTAPSTLRLASVVEIPWSRIDCAAEGRGAFRIGQRLFPLPLTWRWRSAWRRADMESAPTADRKPRHRRTPVPAGAAPSEAEGAEREAGVNAILHPVCPLHGLCGPRVFRPPENGAGTAGPSISAAPLRTTTVFAGACAGRARSGTRRLFFWTVHGPFSFRQDEKKMGGAVPRELPGSPPADRCPLPTRREDPSKGACLIWN